FLMEYEKGKLLHQAKTNLRPIAEDLSHQKMRVSLLLISIFIVSLALIFLLINWEIYGEQIFFLTLFVGSFLVIFLDNLYRIPLSIHAIYTNGISSVQHTIIDHLRDKTFQPYGSIKKIGFGKSVKEGKEFRFIVVYTEDMTKPVAIFNGFNIIDDFLNKLEQALKQNCPNASWVEMKCEDIQGWK
ncbi:MAG: hypothetical protein JSW07_02505, partial [bacterium]